MNPQRKCKNTQANILNVKVRAVQLETNVWVVWPGESFSSLKRTLQHDLRFVNITFEQNTRPDQSGDVEP